MRWRARLPLLVLTLLPAACTTRWERPGAGEAETALFEEFCRREAAGLAPPMLVERLLAPARIETFRDCHQVQGRVVCTVSQRYVPPVVVTDDLNAPARGKFNAMCMTREGFTAAGLRPLRWF